MCISGLIFGDDSAADENALDFGDNLPEVSNDITPAEKDIRAYQAAHGYPIPDFRPIEPKALQSERELVGV